MKCLLYNYNFWKLFAPSVEFQSQYPPHLTTPQTHTRHIFPTLHSVPFHPSILDDPIFILLMMDCWLRILPYHGLPWFSAFQLLSCVRLWYQLAPNICWFNYFNKIFTFLNRFKDIPRLNSVFSKAVRGWKCWVLC